MGEGEASILEGDRVRQFPLVEILSLLTFYNEEMEVVILKTCLYLADSYFKHTQIQNTVTVLPQNN